MKKFLLAIKKAILKWNIERSESIISRLRAKRSRVNDRIIEKMVKEGSDADIQKLRKKYYRVHNQIMAVHNKRFESRLMILRAS